MNRKDFDTTSVSRLGEADDIHPRERGSHFPRVLIAATLLTLCMVSIWAIAGASTFAGVPAGPGVSAPARVPAADVVTATPTSCSYWRAIGSPNVDTADNYLNSVAVVSANEVWAVGYSSASDLEQTLIERWTGGAWTIVPSANADTNDNELYGVAAISANDVWAVGNYYETTTWHTWRTLIERWDGTSWSVVPSPSVGTNPNYLYAVAAVAPNDMWAVGYYDDGVSDRTLIERWNGTSWNLVTSQNVGALNNILYGVAVVSPTEVWAVGYYVADTIYQTLVERWNGTSWSVVPSPNGFNTNELTALAVVSPNDIWAVGSNFTGTAWRTLIERWDGTSWSIVPSPNAGSGHNYLYGVAVVSPNEIWAVGRYVNGGVTLTLTERWDGTEWNVVPGGNPGSAYNALFGIAVMPSHDMWAVGDYHNTGGESRTLIELYSPCPPSPTPTVTPIRTPTATPTSCPIQFTDVPTGSTFYPFVRCLACLGIVNGYPDGTFHPNANVTRGQLSKIVANSAGFDDNQTTRMFEDVPVGSTFFQYIGRLASRGYISGYPCGGTGEPCGPGNLPYFRPNANATRGQISKIDSNAAGFDNPPSGQQFEDVAIGSTYYTYTYRLVTRSIMSGYPCGGVGEPCVPPDNLPYFRPNRNATRGQTSKIVSNTFFPGCNPPDGTTP